MGGIFLVIFKKSFRIIKIRFLETTEIILAWAAWVAIIIEAIADCPFYSSQIAVDSTNCSLILLAYLK
ncbi:hypothetical protein I8752_35585 [Nostocaceae cyanobacterium CENA369]|jgi:hypothetical protein|uniref:Uncharacterized protein n=1 Tax=Dendronalium phyllosphericum CENA369 TaxID=1725256 RepID=A0A8J7LL64_9NOST|nr:hypothetical protein [Dendronalium phyllosphericum]MBH8578179.1 hypothetical protein [Dendronalium phyllosphericum CENA369]